MKQQSTLFRVILVTRLVLWVVEKSTMGVKSGYMGVMGDTLAPKIVIYNKNKDVCKKNELKKMKIDRFMDI